MRPGSKEVLARLQVLHHVMLHTMVNAHPKTLAMASEGWSEGEREEFDRSTEEVASAAIDFLKRNGLWKHASPSERDLFQTTGSNLTERDTINASWRIESIAMLMWALGINRAFPPIDTQSSYDLLARIPEDKPGLFSRGPRLRPNDEISDKRDLMEFWHWRVRTRQLIEEGHDLPPDEVVTDLGFQTYDDIVRFTARKGHADGDLPRIIDDDFVFKGQAFRALSAEDYHEATSIIMERHYALNWLCGFAPGNRWDEVPTDT